MVLQVELYWNCKATVHCLRDSNFSARRLELLGQRQAALLTRAQGVATAMRGYRPTVYTETLCKVFTVAKQLCDRMLLLAYDSNTEYGIRDSKCKDLADEYEQLTIVLEEFRWGNPLGCYLAVNSEGRVVGHSNSTVWGLYPDMSWGCFNGEDQAWLSGLTTVKFIHSVFFASYLNTPNYFWWACVLGAMGIVDSRSEQNLLQSLLAYTTEEDAYSAEPNSSVPSMQQLQQVQPLLPAGLVPRVSQAKTRETRADILAGTQAVSNLQMALLRLLY